MAKKVEVTFIKDTKLNSQLVKVGSIIKLEEGLAAIFIKQRKAINGAVKSVGKGKDKVNTEKVESRDDVLAAKEVKKKEEDAKRIEKHLKESAKKDNPNHLDEGAKAMAAVKEAELKAKVEGLKGTKFSKLSIDELKAIAKNIKVTPNSQAKEKGIIKAITEAYPELKEKAAKK